LPQVQGVSEESEQQVTTVPPISESRQFWQYAIVLSAGIIIVSAGLLVKKYRLWERWRKKITKSNGITSSPRSKRDSS